MDQRPIGGLAVSTVGLGCNNLGQKLDREASIRVVHAALDAGITLFDTADIYGGTRSEVFLGEALRGRWDRVVLATKFGMPVEHDETRSGGSARWVALAVEDSLRRLGTDRIDLYQFHRPDPATPIEETMAALDRLVRDGKVREIGHSNFSGPQIEEADRVATDRGYARFVCAQNHYNLLTRAPERDVLPACRARGLAFLPYFPLASGLLTGKYRPGAPPPEGTRLAALPADRAARVLSDENLALVARLERFAAERDRTLLEVAFAWLLARAPVASVIAGATSPAQVVANVAAAARPLADEELATLDRLTT